MDKVILYFYRIAHTIDPARGTVHVLDNDRFSHLALLRTFAHLSPILTLCLLVSPGPEIIKKIMLNSTEHEISFGHKSQNAEI